MFSTLIYPIFVIINVNGPQMIACQIAGPHVQLDIGNLPGGAYFIRLTGEKTVQVGEIIKE